MDDSKSFEFKQLILKRRTILRYIGVVEFCLLALQYANLIQRRPFWTPSFRCHGSGAG